MPSPPTPLRDTLPRTGRPPESGWVKTREEFPAEPDEVSRERALKARWIARHAQ